MNALARDFPVLRGERLAYLDSAATTLKPWPVIAAVEAFYAENGTSAHRAIHRLGARATRAYESARATVARFLGAQSQSEIVMVRGTTEAINLVAQAFLEPRLSPGDEILVTELEHHSNIVPWQLVAKRAGANLVVVPMTDAGEIRAEAVARRISTRTRMIAVTHVSNVLGTVLPVEEIAREARSRDVPILIDGAQAVPHFPVDVAAIGCDFYAFSGHKTYGPTGIGALYGRAARLEHMQPYQGGGEMITRVRFDESVYAPKPWRFEAGTQNVAGAIGLAAALSYVEGVGRSTIRAHEEALLRFMIDELAEVPGVSVFGAPSERTGVASFVVEGVHAHDVGTIADDCGVALRAGHHCAQPLMERLGVDATVRASLGLYNDEEDVAALVAALRRVREVLAA